MLSTILLAALAVQGIQMPYLGRPSTFIDNGVDLLEDSSFGDGTIEFDIALHGHASFAGIAFRAASPEDFEVIYLRPHLSRQPDALQYTPVFHGSAAWQLYTGEGYTAAAELPLNRWMHVKLVVAGYSARLFLDGAAAPQLTVTSLKRPWARGMVGFWGFLGGANFANLVVTPADTTAPPPPLTPPAARGLLTAWDLSPTFDTTTTRADSLPDTRPASGWTSVTAESSGIVNIGQYRPSVLPAGSPASRRDLVFARSVVNASRAQRMKLVFAYSDAVHLFVNGRLVFEGEAAFRARGPAFLGLATLGPDAVYVDLRPGPNEIVLAVSETFGGWGFLVRLEPLGPEYEPERSVARQLRNSATPQRPINAQSPTAKTAKARRQGGQKARDNSKTDASLLGLLTWGFGN
jgi:hypothetical protein